MNGSTEEPAVSSSLAEERIPMLQAALAYAERGWAVFPVGPDKRPLTEHGFKDATTDEKAIARLWAARPGAGIGVPVPSGHFVLDVDPRNDGDLTLASLIALHDPLPPTVRARTGGGGEHLWFRLPVTWNGAKLPAKIGAGLDIRAGSKAYVIVPPSPHLSGHPYAWMPYGDPEEQTIAEAPAWLVELLTTPDATTHGIGVAAFSRLMAGVPEGERDETIFRYACDLRHRFTPRDEAETLVLAVARRCKPAFPDSEALKKVEQAWKFPAGSGAASLAGQPDGPLEEGPAPAKASAVFQVITGRELLALSLPPRESVLGPFHADEAALVYARRGVGKSLVALGAAAAIAGGSDFLQWKASQPRKVLYVDGELTARMVQKRVELATGMLAGGSEEALDNLTVLSAGINRRSPNIATEEGRRAIEEHLAGVGYLILDALSTLCRSGEENAAESWQPVQDWIVTLRAQGVPSMTLHHAGKSGLQRGTSKREDIYDWILALKHPNDYQAHQGARFEVHFEKTRDFPGGTLADPFEARIDHDGPRDFWTVKTLELAVEEKVISLHRDGLSNRDIAREVQKHFSTVSRILKRAEKEGRLVPLAMA